MQPGMTVQALGPMGAFTAARHPSQRYLFLSGGSGITPLMSMSRAYADLAAPVDIVFLHATRSPLDLVFRAELDLIARRLKGFRLIYLPERREGQADWSGAVGRISQPLLECFMPDAAERMIFCCGPNLFMSAAKEICAALGVPPLNYHQESFDFSMLQEEEPAAAIQAEVAERQIEAAPPTFTVTFARSDCWRLPESARKRRCRPVPALLFEAADRPRRGSIAGRRLAGGSTAAVEVRPRQRSGYWQFVVALDLLHYCVGVGLADPGEHDERVAEKSPVRGHVPDPRLEQVVESTRDHVTLEDLRRVTHGMGELVEDAGAGPIQRNLDEDQQGAVQLGRVQPRAVAEDYAVLLQVPDPLQSRGGAEIDSLRQVHVSDPPVALQRAKDAVVNFVHARSEDSAALDFNVENLATL